MDSNAKYRELREKVVKARSELSSVSCQYHPESEEYKEAEIKKVLAEKELADFRSHWTDCA